MTPIPPSEEQSLRHHSFDGIQEFDRRLPNWWLVLLYGSILFWVGYWAYFEWFRVGLTGSQTVVREMEHIEAARLAAAPTTDNASLWMMSHNHVFVEAGRATYATTCVSCHGDKLQGGIGPNLVDKLWIHGGNPTDLYATLEKGVLAKGMPAWVPVIGAKKSAEVVAFILSHHTEGETIEVQAAWTPILPK